ALWLLLLLALLGVAVALRLRLAPPPAGAGASPVPSSPPPASPPSPAPRPRREAARPAVRPSKPEPPPPLREGEAAVSLVLDDTGQSLELAEEAAARLPRSVTFAVIPHLPASRSSAEFLHARGFPVILHAPMEPLEGRRWRATGGMLLGGMGREEVRRILLGDLGEVPYAEGVNNHMGSRATQDRALMAAVMAVLAERGLYFLDSRTTPLTVAYDEARAAGVPAAFRSVFLDGEDEGGAIMAQLDSLVDRSRREGVLVGIGHLRPRTVEALAARIPYWSRRGVRFLPLREVVR
ncbi:MAG: divergent polysaccharide deacetylase family protein, partial [Acidobacteriota bacterium]